MEIGPSYSAIWKFLLAGIAMVLVSMPASMADSAQPSILLVEDAYLSPYTSSVIKGNYTQALDELGYTYTECNVSGATSSGPKYSDVAGSGYSCAGTYMQDFDIIIWFTGIDYRTTSSGSFTLTENDRDNLATYLDNGGTLFILGQNIGHDKVQSKWELHDNFYERYLHAFFCQNDFPMSTIEGKTSDKIGDGLFLDLSGGIELVDSPSLIFYTTGGVTQIDDNTNSFYYEKLSSPAYLTCTISGGKKITYKPGAISVDNGTYKVAYFAFGLEQIDESGDYEGVKRQVMNRTIAFLSAPAAVNSTVSPSITCDPAQTGQCSRTGNPYVNTTCVDNQLYSTISSARYLIDTGTNNSVQMTAKDGSFNSATENVTAQVDISGLGLTSDQYPIYIQCNDSSGYSGKYDTVILTIDKVAPETPSNMQVNTNYQYTNQEIANVTFNYAAEQTDYMAFSCDGSSYTDWVGIQSPYMTINLTSAEMGCSYGDGSRTIKVQVSDEAGNNQTTPATDSITLDRVYPNVSTISPVNGSYLRLNSTLTLDIYDDRSGLSGFSKYDLGDSVNRSFTDNTAFLPGWGADGTKWLTVWFSDNAANMNLTLFKYILDGTAPTTTDNVSITEGWIATDRGVNLSCTDTGSGCDTILYCSYNSGSSCIPSSTYSVQASVTCPDGQECSKYLNYTSNDLAGNWETAHSSRIIRIDKKAPSITLSQPTEGNKSGLITINLNVMDSGSGAKNWSVLLSNSSWSTDWNGSLTALVGLTSFSTSFTYNTSLVQDGNYNISASSYDTVSNLNQTENVTISVDNTKPYTSDNTTSEVTWYNTDRGVSLACEDETSGCAETYYCTDTSSECNPNTLYSAQVSVVCEEGQVCERFVTYKSFDAVGNEETAKTSNKTRIDKRPPTIALQNPTDRDTYSGTLDILTTISDLGTGTVSEAWYNITYESNDTLIAYGQLASISGWDSTWNSSDFVGEFNLSTNATDALGNANNTYEITFTIDNALPAAVIAYPKRIFIKDDFNLNLSASRASGNIKNTTYEITNSSPNILETYTNMSVDESSFSLSDPITTTGWDDGTYYINFTVCDNFGNNVSAWDWFKVDKTAPSTDDNSTTNWYGSTVNINLTYLDTGSLWHSTAFCIGEISCSPDQAYSNMVAVSCSSGSVCQKYVRYNSSDNVGNVEPIQQSSLIKIDMQKPITYVNTTSSWVSQDLSINISCIDTGSGCTSSSYCVSDGINCTPSTTYIYRNYANVDCSSGSACTKYVLFNSTDSVGNVETTNNTGVLSIDKSKPSSTLSAFSSTYLSGTIEVIALVTDTGSGLDDVYVRINKTGQDYMESMINTSGSNYWTKSVDTRGFGDGQYSVTILANDSVNNQNQSAYTTIYIDNSAPTLTSYALNISTDPGYGDYRVLSGEGFSFSVNATDATNVSSVTATISGANYSLALVSGSATSGSWGFVWNSTQVGSYNITHLYINDTHGNSAINNSVGIEFIVVNGTLSVTLGGNSESEAGYSEPLNMTLWFNKTVSGPTLTAYIPPNTISNYTQTSSFVNSSTYSCGFGSGCSLAAYLGVSNYVTKTTIIGSGSDSSANISTFVTPYAPSVDTNRTWYVGHASGTYSNVSVIRTPYLNISNIYCNGGACQINQNQAFTVTMIVDNNLTSDHTGKAIDVWAMMNSSTCSNMSILGNITSGSSQSVSWQCNITSAENYTFTFRSGDTTGSYNTTAKTVAIESIDTEKPEISLGPSWPEDNIFNYNETVEYVFSARDNVGLDSVWLTLLKSGQSYNLTLIKKQEFRSGSIIIREDWNLTYADTNVTGYYNITNVYMNDSRGNTETYTPSGIYSWFEVRNLTVQDSLSSASLSMPQNLTLNTNVSGNGSEIQSATVTIVRPDGNESIELDQIGVAESVYQYSGSYTNVNLSGGYITETNITLASGVQSLTGKTFNVSYGNLTINIDNDELYLIKGVGSYNLTFFVVPTGGDLRGVNGTIWISNESLVNLTGTSVYEIEVGNITWGEHSEGYPVTWLINTSEMTGNATINVTFNSTADSLAPNSSASITIFVVDTDSEAPLVSDFYKQWNTTNLLETNRIYVNASDAQTAIANVTLYVTNPSSETNAYAASKISPNLYRVSFSDTNQTGNYTLYVNVSDVTGNVSCSSSLEFNVTDEYTMEVTPEYTSYNKGESVSVNFTVRNANSQLVTGYNITVLLNNDTSSNSTIISNSIASTCSFTIGKLDNPVEDYSYTYVIFGNVSKNGNTANANSTIGISRLLETEFVYPDDNDYFATGSGINISVRVYNSRQEMMESVSEVGVYCQKCADRDYTSLTWDPVSQAYLEYPALNAPDFETFSVFAYSKDADWNDQGTSIPGVVLTTVYSSNNNNNNPPGGGSGSGSGSGGGGGGGGNETCVPVAEGPLHGNCADTKDNDCDGATDCSDADCFDDQACLKDFTFELRSNSISIQRGEKDVIIASLRNLGNAERKIAITVTEGCCNVTTESEVILGSKQSKDITIDIETSLLDSLGSYAMMVKAQTLGLPAKELAFTVEIVENPLLERLSSAQASLEELLARMDHYRSAGVDVEDLEASILEATEMLVQANASVYANDLNGLTSSLEAAETTILGISAKLFALDVMTFIYENKYSIATGIAVAILLSYIIMEIGWPYYRIGMEIKRLEGVQASFIQARKETEIQYFNRKIDEKTFSGVMKQKEAEVMQAKAQLKLRKEQKEQLLKSKLKPGAFGRWFKSVPEKLRKAVRRLKAKKSPIEDGSGLPPLSWEK